MYSVAQESVAAVVSFPAMNKSMTVALSFGTAKKTCESETSDAYVYFSTEADKKIFFSPIYSANLSIHAQNVQKGLK